MDLKIKNQLFVVGGATSGFGKAVTVALVKEGAKVIAIARGERRIRALEKKYPKQVEGIVGDITKSEVIDEIVKQIKSRKLSGILVNAGGPPAMSFLESKLEHWDEAYAKVFRWKVALTKALLPKFMKQQYGRIIYLESVSVKQPIQNLVLSNSMRLGVVGFVKTLSQEVADQGITANILAPGYHSTPAVDRLIRKKSEVEGISFEKAKSSYEKRIYVGFVGDPNDFASLAVWLLSPVSRYITGQTITVDGGVVEGSFG